MSIVPESVKCDGCGKNRVDDVNHWRTFSCGDKVLVISDAITPLKTPIHACGDGCASKLFARWLSTGKLTE